MTVEVVIPEMGEYGMELKFVRWLRRDGESVSVGQALFEVDTDKTTVEVEAYAAGTLTDLRVSEGEIVQPRQIVAVIVADDEALEGLSGEQAPAAAETGGSPEVRISSPSSARTATSGEPPTVRVRATPRARRLAREHRLDLGRLSGTGSGGMIVERDVENALANASLATPTPTMAQVRARVAERTQHAWQEIPHFHLRLEVDVTETLQALRPTAAVCAAAARALARHPECNLEWRNGDLVRRDRIDLGLLVDTNEGLLLTTIPRPETIPASKLEATIHALADRARRGRLTSDDLGPRSLTVSNLGMFAVDGFDAVITSPDVLLLSVGRSRTKPVWLADTFQPRQVIELTLAVDHRALDGAEAARMLDTLEGQLRDPSNLE
jgi:pyruvate dehydrogenase E2 component (dihydrolipoyllysine-residue acetyltransferase)